MGDAVSTLIRTPTRTRVGAEWWRGAVIYQIYPRSFRDSNGDGVGDLAGITEKLPYVADLGVDGIWISPFFTSPMKDFGYDVADYRDVDPLFGTLRDFDVLVERAHTLGLKVVIDQVYCHCSDRHAWFQNSRGSRDAEKADWYVWADAEPDGSPPNNWRSVFGGPAWTWDGRRRQYYLHHFLKEQPTFNLHNDAVVEALIDVGRFWIDRGVDGFRLDALNMGMQDEALRDNPPHPDARAMGRPFDMQIHKHSMSHPKMVAMVERLSAAFRAAGGDDFFTVAELGGADPQAIMAAYTLGSDRLSTAYSFDFIGAMSPDVTHIRSTLEQWANTLDDGYPAWAFSNHDCRRVASRWTVPGVDAARSTRLFALLQVALRGVVFVYQGEELGLPQADIPFDKLVDPEGIANFPSDQGRDGARTPMPWVRGAANAGFGAGEPWLPVDARHGDLAADVQAADPDSSLAFYRSVIALRRRSAVLRRGAFQTIPAPEGVLAFHRVLDDETMVCVFNLSGREVDLADAVPSAAHAVVVASVDADQSAPPSRVRAGGGFIATQQDPSGRAP